jgi:hypothetical protein
LEIVFAILTPRATACSDAINVSFSCQTFSQLST